MLKLIIVGLLVLILAGERMNFVAHRKLAEHSNMHWLGTRRLLTDGCPWFDHAAPQTILSHDIATAPSTTSTATGTGNISGFEPDLMAHARAMDARKHGVPNSAAKKMEGTMTRNDHARRKMRSEHMRTGNSL